MVGDQGGVLGRLQGRGAEVLVGEARQRRLRPGAETSGNYILQKKKSCRAICLGSLAHYAGGPAGWLIGSLARSLQMKS